MNNFPKAKYIKNLQKSITVEYDFKTRLIAEIYKAVYTGMHYINLDIGSITVGPFVKPSVEQILSEMEKENKFKDIRNLIEELEDYGYEVDVYRTSFGSLNANADMVYPIKFRVAWE